MSKKLLTVLLFASLLSGCSLTNNGNKEVPSDKTEESVTSNQSAKDAINNVSGALKSIKDKTLKYYDDNKDEIGAAADKVIKEAKDVFNELKDGAKTGQSVSGSSDFDLTAKELSTLEYTPGTPLDVTVNDSKSTLNISDWSGSKIEYSNLDNLNRTQVATAHLSKDNYGKSSSRSGQTWFPTAWNNQEKKIDGKRIRPMDRGHLIAYTLSFNLNDEGKFEKGLEGSLDNPKNLFSQSSYSNQVTFQKYERQVRDAIKAGKKVIYRVQPIYRGDELMARGLWAQAVSDDGMLNFNVYIHNVQPNVKFNYETGKSVIDKSIFVE